MGMELNLLIMIKVNLDFWISSFILLYFIFFLYFFYFNYSFLLKGYLHYKSILFFDK
jgi:hypothetical protein